MPYTALDQLVEYEQPQVQQLENASGWLGTAQTISKMQEVVSYAKRKWPFIQFAYQLIQDLPSRDHYAEAERIFDFVTNHIRFTKDPAGVELVKDPIWTLTTGVGDCDDLCVLLAALQESIGLPTWYATIKANLRLPYEFSHVYCLVDLPGVGRVAEDPSVPDAPFGWEPEPRIPNGRQVWPSSKETENA